MARVDDGVGSRITSSHSPPAVSNPMTVSDTPVRLATMVVWSMNLSAPDSRRKSAETKTAALYATELASAMAEVVKCHAG